MKVCAVTPRYPPASMVGAWLTTHTFLRHLASAGHTVDVVSQFDRQAAPVDHEGVMVHAGAGWIERLMVDADVVVSHLGDNGRAHRAAADRGIPSVRMAHGGNVTPATCDRSALVVWNSASFRDFVGWDGPGIVIHPPTDPAEYATTPGDRVTLVNLSEAKGGQLFWRVAKRSPHRFLGVRGGYGIQILDRAPNVDVIPPTSDMVGDVYSRTRVLLMPSDRETWGRVAVEAMASGIPTIAHPTPGLVESLGSAGVFVDRRDAHGWLEAIDTLTDPGAWAEASARSLARVAELDPVGDLARFEAAMVAVVERRAVTSAA